MLKCFDMVREMTFAAIGIRLILAVICGGAIGMEREYKRRPAGFRTHILICLGAAVTTLTSQYLYLTLDQYTDVARLGAQVVAGIGFIGAGTIIVTNRQRVKGLTTAAGLWTSAIIGLVCGAGFVECAIFATFMVLFAELMLVKIEYRFAGAKKDINLYIEYNKSECIENIIKEIREENIKIDGLEITRMANDDDGYHYHAVMTVSLKSRQKTSDIIEKLMPMEDVMTVEEL